jgi:hypothetical protein
LQKAYQRADFNEEKKHIALLLELKEQMRRQKVMSGEWTEAESHKKLHEELTYRINSLAEERDPLQFVRDYQEKQLEIK